MSDSSTRLEPLRLRAALPGPIMASVNRIVNEALRDVPEGQRAELVLIGTTAGARVAVAAKITDGWDVVAWADAPKGEKLEAGIATRWRF